MTCTELKTSDLFNADACLTAHVLDLASGQPGKGIKVSLLRHVSDRLEPVATTHTNDDGRLDAPLLTSTTTLAGRYTLAFEIRNGFLGTVPVEFEVVDPARHHHVPLVVSPFGYSTYRGAPPHRAPETGHAGQGAPLTVPTQTAPPPGSLGPGLTVHAIDISRGGAAGGMIVDLQAPSGKPLRSLITNSEGRTPEWLVNPGELECGTYEIRFDFDRYFKGYDFSVGPRPFFPCARVRFHVTDPGRHYHIPLLAAPWGYTCYRGS